MKTKLTLLNIFLVLSFLMAACGQSTDVPDTMVDEPAAEVVDQPDEMDEPEVVEEPADEPVVVEEPVVEVPAEYTFAELDDALNVFLADMEAYNTISLDGLNVMLAEDPAPFVLDVRQPAELTEKGWIPGAVNIPLRDLGKNLAYLPSFDTTIVSYCGSGWRCTIALTALEAMGWENVLGLKGGSFGGWLEAGYAIETGDIPELVALDAVEFAPEMVAFWDEVLTAVPEGYGVITADNLNLELVDNPDLILIDGRTQGEVDSKGYIDAPNVTFIALEDWIAMKDNWPADLNTPLVVYCGSGHRSTIAMTMMWAYGYTDVHSLKGGFGGWTEVGFATVGGEEMAAVDLDTPFQVFLADMEGYNTISLDALNLMIAESQDVFVLDVRQPEELVANGWIEGAVNIPLRELGENIAMLPSFDTTIVSYCGSGWRCTIALTALEAMGWENVLGLKGGSFGGWVDAGYAFETGDTVPVADVIDAAHPDMGVWQVMDDMFVSIPEGYGVITPDQLATELVENPDLIVIDTRRVEEWQDKGVIEAANWIGIPLEQFITDKALWPADLDAPIVINCGSGHRSTIAMTILWSYGYTNVRSLKGGFTAWTDAGYPAFDYAMP